MILRNLEPIFRTEEQQHSFNFPYQLGTGSRDSPESAQFINVRVKEGDVVIVASDGVWDNLFDEDVVNIVRECCLATSTVSPNNSSSSSSAFSSSTNNSLSNTGGHFSDYLSKKTSSYGSSLTGSTANTPSTMVRGP